MPKNDSILPKVRLTELKWLPDRVLLVGAPGIGKTEYIKQTAMREAAILKREFVDLNSASKSKELLNEIEKEPHRYYLYIRIIAPHLMPEDISLPIRNANYVDFALPRLLHLFTLDKIAGVIFIDELSNVQRDDQLSLYYAFILEKQIGWVKLNNNVKIVAATNDSEWSELARPLPRPLRNRLVILYVEAPSIQEWIEYMDREYGEGWDRTVAAYLLMYPEDFLRAPSEDDGFTAFPTPRSWTTLALTLKQLENQNLREAIVYGTVGVEAGAKFITFVKEAARLPDLIRRLKEDVSSFDEFSVTEKMLVTYYLAAHHDEYAYLITSLPDEYIVITIMLIPQQKRLQFLARNRDIAKKVANRVMTI